MASQTGQQVIAIHILSNIFRSKDKQTMKVGQLAEYEIRNIILHHIFVKLWTKYGGEAGPRHFYKKSKLSILLDQQSEIL